MDTNKTSPWGFEFVDIEIIDHKKQNEERKRFDCDQCSLFFVDKDKLTEHKKKHGTTSGDAVKCRYCNKVISTNEGKESYVNKKCETCEYRCTQCPQRFLRYSSLVNHEKNHIPKKKKTLLTNKKHLVRVKQRNDKKLKIPRKRNIQKVEAEENNVKIKEVNKANDRLGISPRKKQKLLQKVPLLEDSISNVNTLSTNNKTPKRSSLMDYETDEDANSVTVKNRPITIRSAVETTIPSDDNVVNYKPFSCHICGNTFASQNLLLVHIQSHGENTDRGFKCKHCNEEFDDIYKMQYHLAICKYAEDEVEFTLKKKISPEVVKNSSLSGVTIHESLPTVTNGMQVVKKRGRPKKIIKELAEVKRVRGNTLPPLNKERQLRRRKIEEDSRPVNKATKVTHTNIQRYGKRIKLLRRVKNAPRHVNDDDDDDDDSSNDYTEENPLGNSYTEDENPNDNLETYETSEDNKKKIHLCPFPDCSVKFTREKALLCHMRNHNDDFEESLKCHKCDIPFDDLYSLRSHINLCKGLREEKDEDFHERDHSPSHGSSSDIPLRKIRSNVCTLCGKGYVSLEKLKRCLHEDEADTIQICRLCGEKCMNEESLRNHFTLNHSDSLPFQCKTCLSEFVSEISKLKHMSRHLKADKEFECTICSLSLPTYKDLYFHYSQDHIKKEQIICKICNKMFPDEGALKEHSVIHEEARFNCMFCSKSYRLPAGLNIHLKTHRDKKIYRCKTCYTPFTDSSIFFKHMLFHASLPPTERPFKCGICFVTFKRRFGLETHIKNCHVRKTILHSPCPICKKKIQFAKAMVSHIQEHSIRISKNNMSEVEAEWVKKSKFQPKKTPKKGMPQTRICRDKVSCNKNSNRDNVPRVNQSCKYNTRSKQIVEKENLKTFEGKSDLTLTEENENLRDGNLAQEDLALEKQQFCNSIKTRKNLRTSSKYQPIATNLEENNLTIKEGQKYPINTSREVNSKNEREPYLVTKERPMSFIHVTSNAKRSSKSDFTNFIKSDLMLPKGDEETSVNRRKEKFVRENPLEQKQTDTIGFYFELSETSDLDTFMKKKRKICNAQNESSLNSQTLDKAANYKTSLRRTSVTSNNYYNKHLDTEVPEGFWIKETKYFEPSLGLTKYSCTTCILSFSSQDELLRHNSTHIF